MAKDTSLTFSLYGKDVSATKAMKGVGKESETLGQKLGNMGKVAATAFAGAAAAAAKFAYDAGKAASDLAETQSKVGVIFGKSAGAIEKFATSAAQNLGQSKQEAMDAAANFAIFGKAAGLQGKGLVDFSTRLTTTAADMASFANTTPQEAIDALGAALRGEMEPIRKYGVLLDQETLKNRGTIMGFGDEIGNSLTGGQKVMFATAEIMEQLGVRGSNTLGDFSRTSDGFANKQRIMEANFKNIKVQIGQAVLPVMKQFSDYILENVVPNVQAFVDGLTGVKNKGGDATKSAHDFGQKVKGVIKYISDNQHTVENFAKVIASIFIASKISAGVSAITSGLALMRGAFVKTTATAAITAEAEAAATGGASLAAALPAIAAIAAFFGVSALMFRKPTAPYSGTPKEAAQLPGTTTGAQGNQGIPYSAPTYSGNFGGAASTTDSSKRGFRAFSSGETVNTLPSATSITPTDLSGSGINVVINVAGSVISERDLAVTVRDNIGILMRRQGLNPSILGV